MNSKNADNDQSPQGQILQRCAYITLISIAINVLNVAYYYFDDSINVTHILTSGVLDRNTSDENIFSNLQNVADVNMMKLIQCTHNETEIIINDTFKDEFGQFNDALDANRLKIFVVDFMRMPNVYSTKCGLPMTLLNISDTHYHINNQTHFRNLTGEGTNPAFDFTFLVNYIDQMQPKPDWILKVEDDISFCPSTMHFILQVMQNYNNSNPILIFLGAGASGLLFNKAGIKNILKVFENYFWRMNLPKFKNMNWRAAHDRYLIKRAREFNLNLYTSLHNIVYHPGGETYNQSTTGHKYKQDFKCTDNNEWNKRPYTKYVEDVLEI